MAMNKAVFTEIFSNLLQVMFIPFFDMPFSQILLTISLHLL